MTNQMRNQYVPDYSDASLCPTSWKMYFDHASAYMEAASTLAAAGLLKDAMAMLELGRKANRICRENFASSLIGD